MAEKENEGPLEIERKFLVRMPDPERLRRESVRRIEIRQIYLRADVPGESRRVRRSRWDGDEELTYTHKSRLTDRTRVERERTVTPEEYEALLEEADPARAPVDKVRWCVPYGGHLLEIDVFPFWDNQAFCEAELGAEDEALTLPEWLTVLREVTDDPAYTNSALALRVPAEEAGG